jgi:hypothetical protein
MIVVLLLTSISTLNVMGYKTVNNLSINIKSEKTISLETDDEEIIEEQLECNDGYFLLKDNRKQGIIQTLTLDRHVHYIKKVQLYIAKIGDVTASLKVGIGKAKKGEEWDPRPSYFELYDFFDTYIKIPSSEVSTQYNWIEFDFIDIKIDRAYTYFIVVYGINGDTNSLNCYSIGYYKGSDLYDGGSLGQVRYVTAIRTDGRWYHPVDRLQNDDLTFKLYATKGNDPPKTLNSPNGPAIGKKDERYTFSVYTNDPEDDNIFYLIDWGDGIN